MADGAQRQPSWQRNAGLGFDIVAAMGGLALLGYWIDRRYGSGPAGLIIGAVVGLLGGLYNFLRAALATTREGEVGASRPRPSDEKGGRPDGGILPPGGAPPPGGP